MLTAADALLPPPQGVSFGIFGLGNRQYEHFCAMGKKVEKLMGELGASSVVRRGDGDDDQDIDEDFDKWSADLFAALDKSPLVKTNKVGQGGWKGGRSVSACVRLGGGWGRGVGGQVAGWAGCKVEGWTSRLAAVDSRAVGRLVGLRQVHWHRGQLVTLLLPGPALPARLDRRVAPPTLPPTPCPPMR